MEIKLPSLRFIVDNHLFFRCSTKN